MCKVKHRCTELARRLAHVLSIDSSTESIQDGYGDTPLSLAIKVNNERAVDLLWNTRHFDISTRDYQGNSTLHMVCHHQNIPLIQLIIENTVDVKTTNAFGETPLQNACSANNVFAVEELKKFSLIFYNFWW